MPNVELSCGCMAVENVSSVCAKHKSDMGWLVMSIRAEQLEADNEALRRELCDLKGVPFSFTR